LLPLGSTLFNPFVSIHIRQDKCGYWLCTCWWLHLLRGLLDSQRVHPSDTAENEESDFVSDEDAPEEEHAEDCKESCTWYVACQRAKGVSQ
jgi:hypothetical protein